MGDEIQNVHRSPALEPQPVDGTGNKLLSGFLQFAGEGCIAEIPSQRPGRKAGQFRSLANVRALEKCLNCQLMAMIPVCGHGVFLSQKRTVTL